MPSGNFEELFSDILLTKKMHLLIKRITHILTNIENNLYLHIDYLRKAANPHIWEPGNWIFCIFTWIIINKLS